MAPATPWRWLVAALGAASAVAALGAAGCERAAAPTAPPLDVGLTVDAQPGPAAVRIDYRLVNRTGGPVVVFTGVPGKETHQRPSTSPDAVYVTTRDDGTVEIAKRVFAPPEGVELAVDFVVRGVVVAPGQTVEEAVRIPMPPGARHPYDREARLPAAPKRAVFCLGVAPQGEVPPIPVDGSDADPRPVYPHRASVARVQRLVCGEPFDL